VLQVRKEIESSILTKRYLRDVLKREGWDSMEVKGKAIKVGCTTRQLVDRH